MESSHCVDTYFCSTGLFGSSLKLDGSLNLIWSSTKNIHTPLMKCNKNWSLLIISHLKNFICHTTSPEAFSDVPYLLNSLLPKFKHVHLDNHYRYLSYFDIAVQIVNKLAQRHSSSTKKKVDLSSIKCIDIFNISTTKIPVAILDWKHFIKPRFSFLSSYSV